MAGFLDNYEVAPGVPAPKPPAAPKSFLDAYELAPAPAQTPPRDASGLLESIQAGFQGSAPGLAWRRRMPELVINPETAKWWERAAASFTHVGAELPLMVGGAIVGAGPGAAAGTAVAGPAGTVAGGLLGAGVMMGVVPATIRQSLIEAYKSGEISTKEEWFNAAREVAKQALKEGAINAAAMGVGAVAGRAVGTALAPAVGQKITAGTLAAGVETADLATQIATMVSMPAALEGRLPQAQEFLDAAILIGGLKAAHVTASRVMHTYQTTGKTPAEQVADAKADPQVAADLTRERPPVDPITGTTSGVPLKLDRIIAEAEFLARGGVPEAPNIRTLIAEIKAEGPLQGDMIRDIDRIGAMYDKARLEPLTDPERAELEVLKGRVAELEAKVRAEGIDAIAPVVRRHTETQVAEAKAMAEKRLAELAREAENRALTDAERAERVFLTNAMPEALAKRFGLEPAGEVRLTRAAIDESAQRVHDDILRQMRDVDDARRDSGLAPLGDDHAAAVAALVRARVRTRAARLGRLPEEIYAERPLQIRDETAAEVKAAEEAIPAGAPTFIPPEVDLFGNPIEAPMVPRLAVENLATVEVPLERLVLSKEVPQFKHAADEQGVVAALGGKFDRTGVGPIQVWERLDGTLEVISGRHRLDLARRSGEQTIPAQVHREADGFDARRAATLDAELNIREEQGSVADYAQYFKDSGLSKEAADERGLLARAKGRSGFAIARDGTPDLIASLRAGRLSDEAALSIAVAAPQSEAMQALGMRMVLDGQPILIAVNMMKAAELAVADRMAKGEQGDLWGFDDSAIRAQLQMAKRASAMQRKIGEQISAVIGAAKRPELAKKMGVDVQDPEGIKKKVLELRQTQELWDNWPMHPELVAQLRAPEVTGREGDLKQGAPDVKSPEFRAWFGDSKAVDADGAPLRLFHGSDTSFEVARGSVFATTSPELAGEYAKMRGAVGFKEPTGGATMPIYMRIRNPLVIEADGKTFDMLPFEGKLQDSESIVAIAYKRGNDGVIFRNMDDGPDTGLTRISDVYVAISENGGQIKSAIGNRGTFDPNDPNILRQEPFDLKPETPAELEAKNAEAVAQARRQMAREEAAGKPVKVDQGDLFSTQGVLFQSGPGAPWYSALERQVEAASMKQAPPQGWKDWIRGLAQKGVKAEEVKWSGIEEWLDLQGDNRPEIALPTGEIDPISGKEMYRLGPNPDFGKVKVTKAQVQEFLRGNGVRVTETELGHGESARKAQSANEALQAELEQLGYGLNTIEDPHTGEHVVESVTHMESGIVYPYVPEIGIEKPYPEAPDLPPRVSQIGEALAELEMNLPTENSDFTSNTRFSQYVLPGAKEGSYRELLLTLPESGLNERVREYAKRKGINDIQLAYEQYATSEEANLPVNRQGRFTSSHFDTPNILAHVRFNERTDAEGKRVLFIEEIQSDWAQKGKKEGFAASNNPDGGGAYSKLPPQAPFVGKTEAWVALTLKRMIRYAAENGMDRIAWTTGEQQVSRYTAALRKAVDVIEWTKTPEGVQLVGYKGRASDPEVLANAQAEIRRLDAARETWIERWGDPRDMAHGQRMEYDRMTRLRSQAAATVAKVEHRQKVVDTTEKEDVLSDAIGKAMAERIIKDPNQSGTIEGDNIKIDDTGMATFYDRIVPNVAKDVLKKLGGGKITETEVPTTPSWGLTFRDGPYRTERYEADETGEPVRFASPGEARQYERQHNLPPMDIERIDRPTKQQSFEITPAMREKAMEGLPLFQRERGSYNIAEKLITTMQGADKSTVVHELGHDWLQEMKEDASRPDAPQQLKDDWEILRRELAIGEDGEISRASHEQFARGLERYLMEGEAPSIGLRAVFERFKAWLLEIYQSVMNLNVNINPDLRAVMDRMLATEQEIADARALEVPRAYVAEAKAQEARKIVPGFKAEQVALEPYADELPKGPGEAPDNSHVNYGTIDSPVRIKLTLQRLAEIDQENIQKHRGGKDGVESWQEEQATTERWILDTLGGGEDQLRLIRGGDPNDPKTNHMLRAKKQMMVQAGHESERKRDVILEKGLNATIEEQLQYLASIELLRQMHAEFLGERAAVARAMNALKDTREGSEAVAQMFAAIEKGANVLFQSPQERAMADQAMLKARLDEILLRYNGKSVLDIARLHKEIGTLKGTFKMAEAIEKATKWEMVVEGWKSALLSGPVTPVTNVVGTETFMFMRPAVDALAALIGIARGASPGMGVTDRASMSEAVARLAGMVGGVKDGLKVAYHTLKADEPTGKVEAYRNAIPGRIGEIIRIPYRVMSAGDAFAQTTYARGEIATLAIRQAFNEGLNPSTKEFAARVEHLKDQPTAEMTLAAEQASTRMSFNMPLGEKGVTLQLFVNKWNLQWMIPFIRTPINITKEVARMSPFAPLVGEWRADIAKGGVARDKALAEAALGSGIMALTVAYAFAGNVSGGGSPDPGKNRGKAGVEQPYSIKVGDTWYEYARLQPAGTLIGLAADMALVWDHMTDEEKDKVPKLLSRAFANAVTNQTFLQGITNVINAMSEPARFAPKFLQQLAGTAVPNVIGQPTAMADPVVREVNSALEAVMARLPGMRETLMPKRDWLGEPVQTKERLGVVGPVRVLKESDDKVRQEAARLDISMAAPPKKAHIGKGTGKLGDVELTPEERNKFQEVGGQMAHRILAGIVNQPGYDTLPPLVQKQIFSKVLTASHRVAAVAALPPAKRVAYLQSITEKVQAELSPAAQ